MTSEKFCLRWNDFETNISDAFRELREEKDFFDVTLACDDSQIEAHKVIISACSPFFRNVLRRNPHQHPLIYLKGVKYKELLSVLNFMYMGEVNVAQDELNTFLAVAEDLRVKGLTQNNAEHSGKTGPTKQEDSNPKISYKEPHLKKTLPPPKRALTIPTIPKQNYSIEDDDEIQEVVPVKSEPSESTPAAQPVHCQQASAAHDRYQPVQDHQEEHQTDDDPGTVALDETYAGDEGYDYQYDAGYDNTNTVMPAVNLGAEAGNTDLNSEIQSRMSKNEEGDWQCDECYKTSKVKTNILEHIEAFHIQSSGYNCDICFKVFKTRHSLRTHRNVKHKEITYTNFR